MMELVEAERNLILCLQYDTFPADKYKREFKAHVEVYESAGLSTGATEAYAKILVEEENIETSLIMGDNFKEYLKKGGE